MGNVPKLIRPINVNIQQIDKTATPYSTGVSGRREHLGHVVRATTITIKSQVAFGDRDQVSKNTPIGIDEDIKGYLVLRFKDLTDAGVTLQRGDQITKIGQLITELFILHSNGDPAAHLSGEFTLVRMFFGDRNPIG